MANYYADRYNHFLNSAGSIYDYLSGNYMNCLEGCLLDCGSSKRTIEGVSIFRVTQFRKMESSQITFDTLKAAISRYLSSLHRSHSAACFFIVSDGREIKLYFASETINSESFDSILKGTIPEMKTTNVFINKAELTRLAHYGGVVTGAVNLDRNIVDDALTYVTGKEAIIALVAQPLLRDEAKAYYEDLTTLHDLSSSFSGVNIGFGNATRTNISRQFPQLSILEDYTKKQCNRIVNNQSDLWDYCLWFGSSDNQVANELGGKLAGLLTPTDGSAIEKGRYYLTSDNPIKNGELALLDACYGQLEYALPPSLIKSSLTSRVTTEELASLFQLPTRSFVGINVINIHKTLNDISLFDTNVPTFSGKSFVVGLEYTTNQDYSFAINDFTAHALVTGASGGGKTNTVKLLLEKFHDIGIPFCVIEPSKKDYWHMIGAIADLRIYSSGYDAPQLKLNPLEPEDGVIIGNHIDDLTYALSGAFEMEEATRLSLGGLIRYTYAKFGWNDSEIAYKQSKPYPTFREVLENLDEYSKVGICSGPEVTANIKGSLIRRLETVTTGATGNITNTRNGITGRELCEGSVLVELDDLSLETKPFLTSLLLIKINQFIRQRDLSEGILKNVIVLEEAHNVIPKLSENGVEKPTDKASKVFSAMLSEIRAYGTGIIVADQGASHINTSTIANTKIKILHALNAEADAHAEAFSLRLNDLQKGRLTELTTGDALIGISGQINVCKVKINQHKSSCINNYACIFCKHRRFCEIHTVEENLRSAARNDLLVGQVYAKRFLPYDIKNVVNAYFNSIKLPDEFRLCALGYLLANNHMPCGEQEKRRILFRYLEQ